MCIGSFSLSLSLSLLVTRSFVRVGKEWPSLLFCLFCLYLEILAFFSLSLILCKLFHHKKRSMNERQMVRSLSPCLSSFFSQFLFHHPINSSILLALSVCSFLLFLVLCMLFHQSIAFLMSPFLPKLVKLCDHTFLTAKPTDCSWL